MNKKYHQISVVLGAALIVAISIPVRAADPPVVFELDISGPCLNDQAKIGQFATGEQYADMKECRREGMIRSGRSEHAIYQNTVDESGSCPKQKSGRPKFMAVNFKCRLVTEPKSPKMP